jgi:hypothetical protein
MQGFQPIYSGNTLSQAAGQAGQFTVQAGQARGQMWQSLGQAIGGMAQSVGNAFAKSQIGSAKVPEAQVKAAEAQGVDFGPRERVSTGGGDSGIVQYKPVTQQEFDRAIANQGKIASLQSGDLNSQRALLAVKEAGLRLDTARSEMSLRNFGMSAAPSPYPGQLYPVSPLGLNPASIYGTPPIRP